MSQELFVPLALLIVALSLPAMPLFLLMFRLHINADAFLAQAKKLIEADNADRLIKLCNVVPSAPVPQGVKGMVIAANTGLRDTSSLHKGFDDAIPKLYELVKKLRILSIVAIALGALGVVELMRVKSSVPQGLYLLAAFVVIDIVVFELKLAKLKSDMVKAKETMTDILIRQQSE